MRNISLATLAAAAMLVAAAGNAIVHAEKTLPHVTLGSHYAGQELPDGEGKKELIKLCSGCHDLTFTVSTRDTEEGWTRIVNDMRGKGADGTEEEFAKVI